MIFLPVLIGQSSPNYEYTTLKMEGWTVNVEKKIIAATPKIWAAAQSELRTQLLRIERIVPDGPLAKLKTVKFWIHQQNPRNIGAAFHPSFDWLRDNGQDTKMASGIELGNVSNLITWSYNQPWMVMHELAHAYHALFLPEGFENAEIKATYQAALASKRYDSVLLYNGRRQKAYGMNNQMEYFSEITEAYFGVNDMYPFVFAELKEFDPAGYEMLRKMWGDPAVKLPKG